MNKIYAYITLLYCLLMGILPFFLLEIFGEDMFENDQFQGPIYLEPAKFSFAIWPVIQLGIISLGIYQALPAQRNKHKYVKSRPFIIGSNLSNVLWIICIGFKWIGLTLVFSLLSFFMLLFLTQSLELGKPGKDRKEQLLVRLPVAIHFGWITLMVPNSIIYFLMDKMQWLGNTFINSETVAVVILLCTFMLVIILFIRQQVSINYIMVIIYGLIAIFIANITNNSQIVAFSALGLSFGLLVTYFIVERQQMELSKIQMELTALRNQVNPHFLFNNLNTLSNLIPLESREAHRYLDKLAKFYRYIVSQREEHLIPLQEELIGINHYIAILKERFGDNLNIEIHCEHTDEKRLLPLSLQLLVENAVKHNAISDDQHLNIRIFVEEHSNQLKIENNINDRMYSLETTGMGLDNIRKRYKHFTKQKVEVYADEDTFCVALPLMEHQHGRTHYRG